MITIKVPKETLDEFARAFAARGQSVAALYWEAVRQTAEAKNGDAGLDPLVELLADVSHDIWSHWMRWQFHCGKFNEDGTWTMPSEKVERWTRQMRTSYENLSEKEKDSDREQAYKIRTALNGAGYSMLPFHTQYPMPDFSSMESVIGDSAKRRLPPQDFEAVAAAPDNTLYRTSDSGMTWKRLDLPALGITSPVVEVIPHPHTVRSMFVKCADDSLWMLSNVITDDIAAIEVTQLAEGNLVSTVQEEEERIVERVLKSEAFRKEVLRLVEEDLLAPLEGDGR